MPFIFFYLNLNYITESNNMKIAKPNGQDLEDLLLIFVKTKSFADGLINDLVEDGWTRAKCLRMFRSIGINYSQLP